MSNHSFEKQIKSSVEQFSEKPSEQVWSGLEQQLENYATNPSTNFSFTKTLFWLAAASLVLVAGYWAFTSISTGEISENTIQTIDNQELHAQNVAEFSELEVVQSQLKTELVYAQKLDLQMCIYVCMPNCWPCERLREEVLSDPEVELFMDTYFDMTVIDLMDKAFMPLYKKFAINAAPTMLFFDKEGKLLGEIAGFRDKATLMEIMSEFIDQKPASTNQNTSPSKPSKSPQALRAKVFPNPTTGKFAIRLNTPEAETHLRIIDANGVEIYSEKRNLPEGTFEQDFDFSNFAKGTYFLHCYQQGNMVTERIVVQ